MRRELVGRQTCAGELSSGERMFAGGRRFPGGCIPAKPQLSEVIIFVDLLLRQSTPLQEESPYRRRGLCQLPQFRRANVRRRTLISRQSNFGEAAVVGGNNLFGFPPPAEQPLPEETVSSDEQCAHRKWGCASEINSCERMFAGGGIVAGG